MKKIIIVLVSLFTCVYVASAAKKVPKEYELMKDATTVNYDFDFSSMKVKKVGIKNYVEMNLNMPLEKFINNVESIIVGAANEETEKVETKLVGKDVKADVLLQVAFLEADPDGEHYMKIVLVHIPSMTTIYMDETSTDGGDGDTFVEMFMNGLAKTGNKLGKLISKIKVEANQTK